MTRAAGTLENYNKPVNLYLVTRAIRQNTKLICQQTQMVTTDPRPPSERSRQVTCGVAQGGDNTFTRGVVLDADRKLSWILPNHPA